MWMRAWVKVKEETMAVACVALVVFTSFGAAEKAADCGVRPIPAELFGQNLEHTRSAVQGGLSAQLVRNRKFAGKPQRNGVAMMWEAYGTKALYDHSDMALNRHAAKSRMVRYNEQHSQVIGGLDVDGEAGIRQGGIALRGGVSHNFKAVVRSFNQEDTPMTLRVSSGGRTLALMRRVEAGVQASMSYCINRAVSISSDPFDRPKGEPLCAEAHGAFSQQEEPAVLPTEIR